MRASDALTRFSQPFRVRHHTHKFFRAENSRAEFCGFAGVEKFAKFSSRHFVVEDGRAF